MFGRGWKVGGVVLATFAMAACGSDPVSSSGGDLTAQQLYGTWAWVASEGGIAGVRMTPQTEGFEQTLVMRDPFQIELIIDGRSVASTTFTISPATGSGMEGMGMGMDQFTFAQPLPGFGTRFVDIDESGQLLMVDPCCDGFVHFFSRLGDP